MALVSISEAARLTGKSRTTLHRLIKTGVLSTCNGERNTKLIDTSELLRVFGRLSLPSVKQPDGHVDGRSMTGDNQYSEQVIHNLKQEVEHLRALVAEKDAHIGSLKQAMLLLENRQATSSSKTDSRDRWWRFWKNRE